MREYNNCYKAKTLDDAVKRICGGANIQLPLAESAFINLDTKERIAGNEATTAALANGEINVGILCPDKTVRKVEMLVDADGDTFFKLAEQPEAAPPKPGLLQRFINLFKKNKDPEVKRWNDWDKAMKTADKLNDQMRRAGKTARPGARINAQTVNEYRAELESQKAKIDELRVIGAENRKQQESLMAGLTLETVEKKDIKLQRIEQIELDHKQAVRKDILDRAKNSEFGYVGKGAAERIESSPKLIGQMEFNEKGELENTVMKPYLDEIISSSVKLYLAGTNKNLGNAYKATQGLNDIDGLLTRFKNESGMSDLEMMRDCTNSLGSEIVSGIKKIAAKDKIERDKFEREDRGMTEKEYEEFKKEFDDGEVTRLDEMILQ